MFKRQRSKNFVYIIKDNYNQYVIKIFKKRTSLGIDLYTNEKQLLLSNVYHSPKLIAYNDRDAILVTEYIGGSTLGENGYIYDEYYDKDFIIFLGKEVKKLHEDLKGKKFSNRLFYRKPEVSFIDGLNKISNSISHELDENVYNLSGEFIKHLELAEKTQSQVIHGTLTPSNIIYKDKTLYFIDYELSSRNNTAMDLSIFINESNLECELIEYLIKSYYGDKSEFQKKIVQYYSLMMLTIDSGIYMEENHKKELQRKHKRTRELMECFTDRYIYKYLSLLDEYLSDYK